MQNTAKSLNFDMQEEYLDDIHLLEPIKSIFNKKIWNFYFKNEIHFIVIDFLLIHLNHITATVTNLNHSFIREKRILSKRKIISHFESQIHFLAKLIKLP